MFMFSTSNIKEPKYRKFLAIRLEGFILRMRYVLYQIMIVSLSKNPTILSTSILTLEVTHVVVYIYYLGRYRYARNWMVMASKFNVGFTIIFFALLSFLLSIGQENSRIMSNVAKTLQGLGVSVVVTCILLESVFITVKASATLYEVYSDW